MADKRKTGKAGSRETESLRRLLASERRRSRALEKEMRRFRSLIESTNEVFYIADTQGRLTYVSPQIERLGITPAEMIEKGVAAFIHPQDLERAMADFQKSMETGEEFPTPFRLKDRRGGYRWYEDYGRVLRDDSGNITGLIGVLRDITNRRKMEEARREAEKKAKRLQEQLLQSQKMEAVGTLAGGIAHDFNNLLMGIMGNVSLLLTDTPRRKPAYDKLRSIQECVQSGAELTQQLLGFAREGQYEARPANINRLLEESLGMFGRTHKDVRIRRRLHARPWPIEVDHNQIEHVLLNLFVNACQAMPGGGMITVETCNVRLGGEGATLLGLRPGNFIAVDVTDTGSGMDEKTRKRIFEPFFTTKEMGRGTGMGLASAYGIVRSHGGGIDVRSEPGRGTTFTVYLPASSRAARDTTMRRKAKLRRGTEVALVVDDEKHVLVATASMLKSLGYRVLAAHGTSDALALYRKNTKKVALVILDWIMPDGGGEKAFKALRKMNPDLKIILSSGFSLKTKALKTATRKCSGFLQKPFTLEELSHKVRDALDGA